jgi:lysophospholipase L1-like esterase
MTEKEENKENQYEKRDFPTVDFVMNGFRCSCFCLFLSIFMFFDFFIFFLFCHYALYDEDNFHPNNLGYQLMATAIQEKIVDTKDLSALSFVAIPL